MLKVKKNDKVRVISGKDKGKTGKVLRIEPDKDKIYIERINIIKRHTRKKGQNQPGGIISKEGPIHLSNVRVICPNCGKLSRVGFEIKDSGEKVRICRKCGQQI
jgi:large subunit ribosomal protein L24